MSDTETFELTPVFNEMLNGLAPDHAVWDLNPVVVLDTDEGLELSEESTENASAEETSSDEEGEN